jgi:hypothetical protein
MPTAPAGGFSFGKSGSTSPASPSGMPSAPTGSLFGSFGKAAPAPAVKASTGGAVAGQWTCDTCMLQNPDSAQKCTVCESPRPAKKEDKEAKEAKPSLFGKPADKPADKPPTPPSAFSFKPATPPAKEEKPAAPAVPAGGFSFSGFGKPATPPAKEEKPAAPAVPAGGFSFSGFGKAATPAPAAKPSLFAPPTSASTPSSPAPFGTQGPSFTGPATPAQAPVAPSATPSPFQLGTKAPTPAPAFTAQAQNLPAPTAQPASAFGNKPLFGAQSGSFGSKPLFGQPQPTPPAAQTPPSPAATPSVASAAPVQKFTPPARRPVPASTSAPPKAPKSMGDALERLMADVADDLGRLGSTLKANRAHHDAVEAKNFPPPSVDNIAQHDALPLSALDTVHALTTELGEQLAAVRAEVRQSDITLAQLQSRMLKSESPCNTGSSAFHHVSLPSQPLSPRPR